jgi:hypothetical protein
MAVTDFSPVIGNLQVPVPEQAPYQPEKTEPLAALAVSETLVPSVRLAMQVAPQLMPLGVLVTVPLPLPIFLTVSVYFFFRLKVAVTARLELIVALHGPVPLHAPLQPANTEPVAGVAVSVS